MKITVNTPKPRNPLVAAARFRRAGSHRPSQASLRQKAMRELQRDLSRMKPSP